MFGRVHRPNIQRRNALQKMLLYVTEVNSCLLSRTINKQKKHSRPPDIKFRFMGQ
jgi:hypothetical protein